MTPIFLDISNHLFLSASIPSEYSIQITCVEFSET